MRSVDTDPGPDAATRLPAGATIAPGVLTVAVDPSYPPYAGTSGGKLAGLDVDIAAALADDLGLKVRFVDMDRGKLKALVTSPTADLALSGLTTSQIVAAGGSPGGIYAFDGPMLFTSKPATLTLDDLGGERMGAQERSEAWWRLRDVYGQDVSSFNTLRDAFGALTQDRLDVVAGDALVGGYISRDFRGVTPAGVITGAPVEVVVLGTQPALSEAVAKSLLGMEANGLLEALRSKWGGDRRRADVPGSDRIGRIKGRHRLGGAFRCSTVEACRDVPDPPCLL